MLPLRPHLALDGRSQRFQLDEAECFDRSEWAFQHQLFRCEPIDALAIPAEFASTSKDRPVEIVLVRDGIAMAQARTVDGPMLPEKVERFVIPAARNLKVGGDLKPALEHPMHGCEIRFTVIAGQPDGEFGG